MPSADQLPTRHNIYLGSEPTRTPPTLQRFFIALAARLEREQDPLALATQHGCQTSGTHHCLTFED